MCKVRVYPDHLKWVLYWKESAEGYAGKMNARAIEPGIHKLPNHKIKTPPLLAGLVGYGGFEPPTSTLSR